MASTRYPCLSTCTAEDRASLLNLICGYLRNSQALLNFALSMDLAEKLRRDYKQEALVPFSSATKLSCAVVRQCTGTPNQAGRSAIVLCKGAPEYVLKKCASFYRGADGAITPLTPEVVAGIMEAIEVWC